MSLGATSFSDKNDIAAILFKRNLTVYLMSAKIVFAKFSIELLHLNIHIMVS